MFAELQVEEAVVENAMKSFQYAILERLKGEFKLRDLTLQDEPRKPLRHIKLAVFYSSLWSRLAANGWMTCHWLDYWRCKRSRCMLSKASPNTNPMYKGQD